MLDEFVWGKVGRISPEAPVPVVEVTGESFYPGGAANVARNLREFIEQRRRHRHARGGSRRPPACASFWPSRKSIRRTQSRTPSFRTIVKTRIIARNQQIVRVDREQTSLPHPGARFASSSGMCVDRLAQTDAIIFEDYGKGFLSAELVGQICVDALAAWQRS